jgi:hypothetical protein
MKSFSAIILLIVLAVSSYAQDKNPWDRNVYFGEQHIHTVNSPDAFAFGTRNTPDDAYKFAKGEPVKNILTGETWQKQTPYDWIAVTDHAEYLGMMPLLLEKNSPLADTEIGKLLAAGKGEAAFQQIISSGSSGVPIPYLVDPKVMANAWQAQKDAANRHYEPGKFTTLIAFEWSSQPNAQNLHHNVFFRDDKGPDVIFSAFNSFKREDLWTYQEVQRSLGHDNISIPHNSNVSNSMMFRPTTSDGAVIDKSWAERYNANSPAVEILQTKGSSETNPAMSPMDEFAGFESGFVHLLGSGGVLGKNDYSFVRRALQDGVGFQEMIGANPFKFGVVAGADSHNAASSNEEDNYPGVHGNTDKTAEIRLDAPTTVAGEAPKNFGTPGATAVWADENTRAGIFDGLKRKETYGTSGPLIRLRAFGGWDFTDADMNGEGWVKTGYERGVHMGSDLPEMPSSAKAPTFMIAASKDPESGNLDRIQVVKGYYKNGYPFERVYDVAWSGDRKPDPQSSKVPAVGNTVDIKTATYTNDIGEPELKVVWTDPDFDPALHAVYYIRVIEIPTPRWSTYDAVKLGRDPLPDVPATIQERAYSSPFWYTPDPSLVKKPVEYPGLIQRVH